MTNRSEIENAIKSVYAARKAGDLDGTMKYFTDDVVFGLNARGTGIPALANASVGKAEVTQAMRDLIDNWRFDSWQIVSLVVEGDKVSLHSKVSVTCVSTKKTNELDLVDHITFRDGKIAKFYQSTDTAQVMALATP
jgi:ketosteroid isomerase-like protein